MVSVTPSKAETTTTGRSPAFRCRTTTSTAAATSAGLVSTEPPNLSTTIGPSLVMARTVPLPSARAACPPPRHAPVRPAQDPGLVPVRTPRAPVPTQPRSMAGPGCGGHAPADPGVADRGAVRRLHGPIPLAAGDGRRPAGFGAGGLERPRLQPPGAASPRRGDPDLVRRLAHDRGRARDLPGSRLLPRAILHRPGAAGGAVDTNVRRWLVRRLGAAPGDRAGLSASRDGLAASAPIRPRETAAWTHATMEFGARVCTARNPRCGACPVSRGCPSRINPPHVAVPRQSAATASTRAARGALLRALSAAPNHRLSDGRARKTVEGMVGAANFGSFTARLEQDGLLHRSGRAVVLGPPPQGS
jgi:hypothetical protein